MTMDPKYLHEAYLAREEARVDVDGALKTRLRERLFPARRLPWFAPAFALVAVVALMLVNAQPHDTALQSPSAMEGSIAGVGDATDTTDEFLLYSLVDDEPVLFDDDQVVPGLRGSYCDATMCVDMTTSWDAYEGPFTQVSPPLTLRLPREASNVQFGVRNEAGTMLRCALDVDQLDATTYRVNECGDLGQRYFLSIEIWWEDGGDATYFYPIEASE